MNLEPETRRGYYISAEMKKVWAVEMELLKKLLEVCKKHNLRIWAEGGTLLGAVREHGYIPWDDDIDMAMPREDYDKLREVASEEFRSPYFFQCGYTDLFPNGQTKIRKDGTAAVIKRDIWQNYHQGIFIDIFPLDFLPDNEEEYTRFLKTREEEKGKLKLYCDHYYSFTNWSYTRKVLQTYFTIKRVGFNNYFRRYDELIKQYSDNNGKYVSIISWNEDSRYIREKIWYNGTIYMPFEGILIPIPEGYHEILTKQYGDYLKPAKAPSQHGSFFVLDTEHSYLDYIKTYRKKHRCDSYKTRWKSIINVFKKCT